METDTEIKWIEKKLNQLVLHNKKETLGWFQSLKTSVFFRGRDEIIADLMGWNKNL